MIRELVRRLFGYVRFNASGGDFERFLSLCQKNGIRLWGIERIPGGFSCCVGTHAYPLLRGMRRKCGFRMKISEKHGLRFRLRPLFRRRGLLAGAALFWATVLFLSAHVWSIEVEGNETLSREEILSAAETLGLSKGMLKSRLDPALMREELMLALPKTAWVSVNTLGCTATVAVKEKTEKPPIVDQKTPCDVVARFDGQIVELESFGGKALVKVGDAVRRGELLISGRIEDESGETPALEHAAGRVTALVRIVLSARIPKEETVKIPTGEIRRRASMRLFGVEIPLSLRGKPQGDFERTVSRFPFRIGEAELPIEIFREEWAGRTEQTREVTAQQARRRAQEELEAELCRICPGAEVQRRTFSFSEAFGEYTASCVYLLKTDIAQERQIEAESGDFSANFVQNVR